eukprot:TRINITY_DN6130_c0_g1_i1.p1 TRINITY_DN6130_c0_g1~~TRINITY_DN6130_c0_g1_i1.p1  ORF type:complete len:440 (-),score=82.53 TRINITY_DN6130_c0_g1_i1:22-1314(-)
MTQRNSKREEYTISDAPSNKYKSDLVSGKSLLCATFDFKPEPDDSSSFEFCIGQIVLVLEDVKAGDAVRWLRAQAGPTVGLIPETYFEEVEFKKGTTLQATYNYAPTDADQFYFSKSDFFTIEVQNPNFSEYWLRTARGVLPAHYCKKINNLKMWYRSSQKAVAIFDFVGEISDELSINVGDELTLISMCSNSWHVASFKDEVGYVPDPYVELVWSSMKDAYKEISTDINSLKRCWIPFDKVREELYQLPRRIKTLKEYGKPNFQIDYVLWQTLFDEIIWPEVRWKAQFRFISFIHTTIYSDSTPVVLTKFVKSTELKREMPTVPAHTWKQILEYLDPVSIITSAAMVSKAFHGVLSSDYIWRKWCREWNVMMPQQLPLKSSQKIVGQYKQVYIAVFQQMRALWRMLYPAPSKHKGKLSVAGHRGTTSSS